MNSERSEEALVGSLMLDPSAIDRVQLASTDFADDQLGQLFAVMQDLRDAGRPAGGIATTKFKASTNGKDQFGLKDRLQQFADEYWLPDHVDDERGTEIILEAFKRKVAGELELIGLTQREE